jgi:hypothetical protein
MHDLAGFGVLHNLRVSVLTAVLGFLPMHPLLSAV